MTDPVVRPSGPAALDTGDGGASRAADARVWIRERKPEPPPELLAALDAALAATAGRVDGELGLAGTLAEAALDRLRAVLASAGDRSAALDLLAADALLTYACEAAAKSGPAALVRYTDAYGPARLAELLPSAGPASP